MKVTILGCGTSQGVPRIGGLWGNCDPSNPKNRRRRVSIMVEQGGTAIIVDTPPDFREQCLDANVSRLDGVLYTHDHADHTHGIDDLRGVAQSMKSLVPVYGNKATMDILKHRFGYIFEGRKGYPSVAELHEIDTTPFQIGTLPVQPLALTHGKIISYGYRFNTVCYTTDFNAIPQDTEAELYGLDLWILDALRYEPHPTHNHLDQALAYIEKYKPKRAILTHMTWDMDYETLKNTLPKGVEPGYDGMVIDL